ncbi:MAG: hypothetical protein IJA69_03020, partial [Clostridia bacterium]|nr:hypothetical protein [Clostridia bacterium]
GIKNIKKYVETSKNFEQARHNYELEIVEWLILYMLNGGEGWLIPDGYDELFLLVDPNVDILFRAGIVKTLLAIGMDEEVVEEGIEKNAKLWRKQYMLKAFAHKYEPFLYGNGQIEPADQNHKQNWLKLREYEYYYSHKESVDSYGELTEAMKMSKEQMLELIQTLSEQNTKRDTYVKVWKSMSLEERKANYARKEDEELVEQIFNEVVSSFEQER